MTRKQREAERLKETRIEREAKLLAGASRDSTGDLVVSYHELGHAVAALEVGHKLEFVDIRSKVLSIEEIKKAGLDLNSSYLIDGHFYATSSPPSKANVWEHAFVLMAGSISESLCGLSSQEQISKGRGADDSVLWDLCMKAGFSKDEMINILAEQVPRAEAFLMKESTQATIEELVPTLVEHQRLTGEEVKEAFDRHSNSKC